MRRVVPDLSVDDLRTSAEFYTGVFGFETGMDLGWAVGLVSPSNPTAQLQLFANDPAAPTVPLLSIEVRDVDAVHAAVVRHGTRIVHPLTDESWGVRRFFLADPDGHVVNVMMHR